jgi:GTPase SAR1 family protein
MACSSRSVEDVTGYTPTLCESDRRIVIVGGPMAGKSTLARQLRTQGYPTFCADPRTIARAPESDVTYLPSGLSWSGASGFVVGQWLPLPGPWVLEGHAMARALRKYLAQGRSPAPADRILVIRQPHPAAYVTPAQEVMTRAVLTVWDEIAPRLTALTQYLSLPGGPSWSPLEGVNDLAARIGQEMRPGHARA